MNKIILSIAAVCLLFSFNLSAQYSCKDAVLIEAGQHMTPDSINMGEIPLPVCSSGGVGADAGVWYQYIPSENFTLLIGSSFSQNAGIDNRVQVYTGTCEDRICVGGDDDSGQGFLFELSLPVLKGQTYYIAFDNRWDSKGFLFQLTELPYIEPVDPPVTFLPVTISDISAEFRYGVVDMNGDFLDDIVSVSRDQIEILFQQEDGSFETVRIDHDSVKFIPVWSLTIGDLNGDGIKDLVYGDREGVTFMISEEGGKSYREVSGDEFVFCQRGNFVDLDNDGHLDVFMCHDVAPNVYYMNDGAGNLTFNQGGMGDFPSGGNYGSIWLDYDNDGDPDLFIAKCRGGASGAKINELFRNDGNSVFTNVSEESGLADPIQTWSAAVNDYDNDGWMDLFVGASSPADGMHKFMRNNGDGTFSDITEGSGWEAFPYLSIEYVSFDFDNDGYPDVWSGRREIMFNKGDLTFAPAIYNFPGMGAIGDLNNDGFLDIRIGRTVYYNQGNDNNWIKVNLQGTESNREGIGARVEIYGAWGKQIRDVQSGVGFRYMHTTNAHFGIGQEDIIDSLIVIWPSGIKDIIENPSPNQALLVIEGEKTVSTVEPIALTIEVFPNPASDFLNIKMEDPGFFSQAVISGMDGSIVKSIRYSGEPISIKDLIPGVYTLLLVDKEQKRHQCQFVKQ